MDGSVLGILHLFCHKQILNHIGHNFRDFFDSLNIALRVEAALLFTPSFRTFFIVILNLDQQQSTTILFEALLCLDGPYAGLTKASQAEQHVRHKFELRSELVIWQLGQFNAVGDGDFEGVVRMK